MFCRHRPSHRFGFSFFRATAAHRKTLSRQQSSAQLFQFLIAIMWRHFTCITMKIVFSIFFSFFFRCAIDARKWQEIKDRENTLLCFECECVWCESYSEQESDLWRTVVVAKPATTTTTTTTMTIIEKTMQKAFDGLVKGGSWCDLIRFVKIHKENTNSYRIYEVGDMFVTAIHSSRVRIKQNKFEKSEEWSWNLCIDH